MELKLEKNIRRRPESATKQMVIDSIQTGVMRIIWKNSAKEFRDCEGNIVPTEDHFGKWENDKCLVPSSKIY